MKLNLESAGTSNFVRAYAPGEVRIGASIYRRSLVVSADRVIADWRPASFDELLAADMEVVANLEPELVVLGAGRIQRFPSAPVLAPLSRRGVGVEVMVTDAACRTFNILLAEDRRVVAALIV